MTTDPYFLSHGPHRTAADGRCAMEFVAYLAGEPHSDQPACVSPLLRKFCIAFNDALDDGLRQRLRPYLARMIGTADDGHDKKRAWLCADWLVRVHVPAWLELAGLTVPAARLRGLPPVTSRWALRRAKRVLAKAHPEAGAARDAAEATALNSAGAGGTAGAAGTSAAGCAVLNAARAAAGPAAWVVWLAWDVAREAARAAAWAAAGHAARDAGATAWVAGDAAWDAIRPTVVELQRSTFDLLDRMLPTEPLALPAVETVDRARVPVGAR